MSLDHTSAGLSNDLNTIGNWLALDDFSATQPEIIPRFRAIVLLGNQVIATLTSACQVAQSLPQSVLLFSGGIGHATHFLYENLAASEFAPLVRDGLLAPGMSEAEMCALIAERAFSIPSARILLESQSTNGGQNARFSLRLLQQAGLSNETVVLIQDPLMQRRSALTWTAEAERAGLPSNAISHAPFAPRVEPGPDGQPQLIAPHFSGTWTFARYLGLLLGEIARLHDDENGYGPRGKNFLPHVDIPAEVWESYQRVLASQLANLAAR